MNANGINGLQAAIVADFGQYLSGVQVAIYAGQFSEVATKKTLINVPAVWLDFESGKQGADTGTEQVELVCTFTAYAITRVLNNARARNQDAQALAQQVLLRLQNNRFGLSAISRPSGIDLKPMNYAYLVDNGLGVCAIRWQQSLYLGESVWDSTGVTPTEVWLGLSPEIGIPYVDKYIRGDL